MHWDMKMLEINVSLKWGHFSYKVTFSLQKGWSYINNDCCIMKSLNNDGQQFNQQNEQLTLASKFWTHNEKKQVF
jgi:hypothetical protein